MYKIHKSCKHDGMFGCRKKLVEDSSNIVMLCAMQILGQFLYKSRHARSFMLELDKKI